MTTGAHVDMRATAPTPPRLNVGEIHVWKASLDETSFKDDMEHPYLSTNEVERAARYRFPRDRRRFVAGRVLLREILGGYLGGRPSELVFEYGSHGKPRLAPSEGGPPLHFNVTHADSLALYAVAREGEVGIDMERIREIPEWESIAGGCFTEHECARLRRLSSDRRRREFFQAWTRQEALLKASGQGLTGEKAEAHATRDSGYSLHAMTPAPGYLAALASRHPACRVVFMTWSVAPASTLCPTVETQGILT